MENVGYLQGSFEMAAPLDHIAYPGKGTTGVGGQGPNQTLPVPWHLAKQQVVCHRNNLRGST